MIGHSSDAQFRDREMQAQALAQGQPQCSPAPGPQSPMAETIAAIDQCWNRASHLLSRAESVADLLTGPTGSTNSPSATSPPNSPLAQCGGLIGLAQNTVIQLYDTLERLGAQIARLERATS